MIEPLFLSSEEYLIPSLPTVWFGVVMFALAMYVLLDGFDFGVGIIYGTRTDNHEKETLLRAFGPIWDANEVWLVAFGTMLLAAFPVVYSELLSDHYLLAIGAVLALLARGLGPELREQREDEEWRRVCDRLFVGGSIGAPILLGMLVGSWVFGAGSLSLPSFLTGIAVLTLSVTTGGAFLAAKTEGGLRTEIRKYADIGTVAYLGSAVALLAVVFALDSAGARDSLLSPLPILLVLATVVLGVAGIVLGRQGRHRARFATSAVLAVGLVTLSGSLMYPTVYPPTSIMLEEAIVSPLALNLVTVLGLPVLVLVLWYFKFLYGVFSGPVEGEGYSG